MQATTAVATEKSTDQQQTETEKDAPTKRQGCFSFKPYSPAKSGACRYLHYDTRGNILGTVLGGEQEVRTVFSAEEVDRLWGSREEWRKRIQEAREEYRQSEEYRRPEYCTPHRCGCCGADLTREEEGWPECESCIKAEDSQSE